jgi:hypothetical protein
MENSPGLVSAGFFMGVHRIYLMEMKRENNLSQY